MKGAKAPVIWIVQCRGNPQGRRTIQVPDTLNVEQLHTVLQTAWGVSAADTFVLHDEDHNVSITNDVDLYAHEGMAPIALDYFDERIHRYWLWAAECQLAETMQTGQRWQYLWSSYDWLCTVEAAGESQSTTGPICLEATSWTIPNPNVFSKQQYQVRSNPEPDYSEINEQLQALHLPVLQRKLPPICGGAGQQLDPEAWLQFLEQQWDLAWLRPALNRSQWLGICQLPILRWYARLLDELQRLHPLRLDKGQRIPGALINRFLREGWSPSQAGWVQEYYAERQRKKQAQSYFRYLLQLAAAAEHAVVARGEAHIMHRPRPQNDEQWVGLYLCLFYHSAAELVPPLTFPSMPRSFCGIYRRNSKCRSSCTSGSATWNSVGSWTLRTKSLWSRISLPLMCCGGFCCP